MIKKYINIGLAVDTEMGLVVPVIKDAELSAKELDKSVSDLADKARRKNSEILTLKDQLLRYLVWLDWRTGGLLHYKSSRSCYSCCIKFPKEIVAT